MNELQNDDIDLFELFKKLWDGKLIISAFVTISILLGAGYLLTKNAVYESKLMYNIDTIPPFYKEEKVSSDFKKKFYSINVFEDWKKNNSNTLLVFDDFNETEVIDGIVLSKSQGKLLAILKSGKKGISYVLVKSNNLNILNDFFKYTMYIIELLKDEYVERAKDELKIIESRFKDLNSADSNIVDIVLSIDRYIVSANKGANVLDVQRPTMPYKVSPKNTLILSLSAVLGGMVGVLFIIVLNAIKNRKND